MSNHTPGPWSAHNYGPHRNNPDIDNWTIHYGTGQEHVVDHVYSEADANLIAAAPDMLAALQAVVDAGDEYWTDDFHLARCLAKAAIAKAEGC